MSAQVAALRPPQGVPARLALLGTGTVGSAVWARLAGWQGSALGQRLSLVHAANSRYALGNPAGIPSDAGELPLQHAPQPSSLEAVEDALAGGGTRIVIDATASEAVAAQHAHWLARGIHVVTACKLGQGTTLARWQAIQAARRAGGTCYGDSATVGAGLPLLRSLRALSGNLGALQSRLASASNPAGRCASGASAVSATPWAKAKTAACSSRACAPGAAACMA